ncbi:hypothetical protein BN2364_1934 [Alloalcanivorax xenomutans]|nr:hypothetical protein BN2364_1934 [Alloalcanivorax xenomutans]
MIFIFFLLQRAILHEHRHRPTRSRTTTQTNDKWRITKDRETICHLAANIGVRSSVQGRHR